MENGTVIVRPKSNAAIAKLRALNLGSRLNSGAPADAGHASALLTDEERDLALLALLQHRNLQAPHPGKPEHDDR